MAQCAINVLEKWGLGITFAISEYKRDLENRFKCALLRTDSSRNT